MFWKRSQPSPSRSISWLRKNLLRLFTEAAPGEVYTLAQLAERFDIKDVGPLATVLAELSRDQIVDQIFRVESPKNRGGIEDFPSLESIPDTIHDPRQDREIVVEPQMVRTLFTRHGEQRPVTRRHSLSVS
jgi:hypothetical protein